MITAVSDEDALVECCSLRSERRDSRVGLDGAEEVGLGAYARIRSAAVPGNRLGPVEEDPE